MEILFVGLFVLELMSLFLLAFQNTLGWDGIIVWEVKARYAFLNGGVLPAAFFRDPAFWFANPDYPLMLPFTEAWFYVWMGETHQFWIKLIFPLWYLAGMSILLIAAENLTGKRWIAWLVVLLFPLVPSMHDAPGGFQVGFADAPLSVIYLAAICYLLRFIRNRSPDAMALFIALGATLPLIKPEGSMLWATLSVPGTIAIWQTRNVRIAILSCLPGAGLIAFWRIFIRAMHVLPPQDYLPVTFETLRANFHHVGRIRRELFYSLTNWQDWGFFWPLVGVAMIAILLRWRNALGLTLMWLLLAPMSCYCGNFLFTNWIDYVAHMETSLSRHLIQIVPVGWLMVALALKPFETPLRSTSMRPDNFCFEN